MAFETRKTIFQNKLNLDMGNLYKMNGTSSNQEYANANNYEDVDYSTNNEINMNKALQDVLINTRDKLEKQRQALSKSTSTYIPLHDRTEIDNDNIDELREIEDQLTIINMYINELERQSKLNEYNDIIESVEYQSFVEHYTYDTDEIANGAARALQSEVPYDLYENYDRLAIAEYLVNQYGTVDKVINNNAFMQQEVKDMLNNYNYMSEEERNIYHYLYVTEGEESAETYQSLIQSEINQARGVDLANQFLNELDINDEGKVTSSVSNILDTSIQGLGDGITTFFAGINNALENNEILTAEEYRNLVILQTLSENSHILDGVYEFNSALGNMVPAIVTSAIVSYLGSPAAGAKVASTLIGTSAYGNAKHQALNRGNDVVSSTVYGILVGGSEAALEYFLGSIPWLSKLDDSTSFLVKMFKEGGEEALQEVFTSGIVDQILLGKDITIGELTAESVQSFIDGAIVSGILNGAQSIPQTAINVLVNGEKVNIPMEKIKELTSYLKNTNIKEEIQEFISYMTKTNQATLSMNGAGYFNAMFD